MSQESNNKTNYGKLAAKWIVCLPQTGLLWLGTGNYVIVFFKNCSRFHSNIMVLDENESFMRYINNNH